MQDISVNDIINTIKDKKRRMLLSTANEDDFTLALKNKKNWTEAEYKQFFKEYSKIYKTNNPIDYMLIKKIKKEYNFSLTVEDYFNIIDELNSIEKQKEYINHYIWYYHKDITEDFFLKLKEKKYFSFLAKKSKVLFLTYKITINDPNEWVLKYFTEDEIKESFINKNFFLQIDKYEGEDNLIKAVEYFYHQYEKYMNKKIKLHMFLEVVKTGKLSLIDCFIDKIKILSKKTLIFNICSDMASGNVFEILNHLHYLGVKFTQYNLKEVQNNPNWHYLENTNLLLLFFKNLKAEKEYQKLNKRLKDKNKTKNKVIKI